MEAFNDHFFSVLFIFYFNSLQGFFFSGSFLCMDPSLCLISLTFPLVCYLTFYSVSHSLYYKYQWSFCLCLGLVFFLLLFSFNGSSVFSFLVMVEICTLLMTFFILWFGKDQDKYHSASFMFLMNLFPSILFMYFCSSHSGGSFNFIFSLWCYNSALLFTAMMVLLMSKLPFFLFHFWLTKAHVSASGCGSMILASLLLKIGTVGIFKFSDFFLEIYSLFSPFFYAVGSLTLIYFLPLMLRFFDLKFLVACSSICHMAPTFPLLLGGSSLGVYCSYLMMVSHSFVSFFLFFLVSVLYEVSYNRSVELNKSLQSLGKTWMMIYFLFLLFNLGFPPFASFLSELYFFSLFTSYSGILCPIFFISLLMSGLVFFFFLSNLIFDKKILWLNLKMSTFFYSISLFYMLCFLLFPFVYY